MGYEDNLDVSWEGDREKLPLPETLEAKLFGSSVTVIHAMLGGAFAGGAIIKEVKVPVKTAPDPFGGRLEGQPGHTPVGYIDTCATVAGTHAGSIIWNAVASMKFAFVACHSILLQSTVSFWKSRGMWMMNPDRPEDCELFRDRVRLSTSGKLVCELSDLKRALPSSNLPLLVW